MTLLALKQLAMDGTMLVLQGRFFKLSNISMLKNSLLVWMAMIIYKCHYCVGISASESL